MRLYLGPTRISRLIFSSSLTGPHLRTSLCYQYSQVCGNMTWYLWGPLSTVILPHMCPGHCICPGGPNRTWFTWSSWLSCNGLFCLGAFVQFVTSLWNTHLSTHSHRVSSFTYLRFWLLFREAFPPPLLNLFILYPSNLASIMVCNCFVTWLVYRFLICLSSC